MKALISVPLRAASFGCALLVSACGGGGDSGNGPTPSTGKSLTLSGLVTDGPIPQAVVTVTIAGKSFATTADASGRYRVTVTVPESSGTSLTMIEAKGPAAGPHATVVLNSLTDSFNTLLAAAGTDQVIDASETPTINVTHLSTANTVLAIESNGGVPTTEEALHQVQTQVDPQAALELAAAIKLIIDSPTSYSLPSGSTSTLAFAQNLSARTEFITEVKEQHPDEFAQAQESTVSDPDVAPPPTENAMPESLTYVASVAEQNSFNFLDQALVLTFNDNNTGKYLGRHGVANMQWEVEENAIKIVTDEPVALPGYWTVKHYDPDVGDYYDCVHNESLNSLAIYRLSPRSARINRGGSDHQVCYYWNGGEFEREAGFDAAAFVTTIADENILPAPTLTSAKAFALYTLNVADEESYGGRLAAEQLSFNPGGAGTSKFFAGNFTWEIVDGGKTLKVNFANGVVSRYRAIRNVDSIASVVLINVSKPDGTSYVDVNLRFEATTLDPLTPDLIPGAYYQFGKGEEIPGGDPYGVLTGFRLEYFSDGTGRQVSHQYVYDENGDVLLDENGNPVTKESSGSYSQFFWNLTTEKIVNERTSSNVDFEPGCTQGSEGCVVWDRRESFPLNFVEQTGHNRVYMLERRQVEEQIDMGIGEDTPFTYLLRFYDREDLPNTAKQSPTDGGRKPSGKSPTPQAEAEHVGTQGRAFHRQ